MTSATARRISGAILLSLAPLLLFGGIETHLGHGAEDRESPIFADASHAEQATHWEATNSVATRRCQDCLAPAQPLEPAPNGAGRLIRDADGTPLTTEAGSPSDPHTHRSHRPRAPPSS